MNKGFTLIEIMTVLGIVVIIATTSLMYLGGFARERTLNTVVRSLTAFIRDAQQRSINQEQNLYWGVRIENNVAQKRYLIFSASSTTLTGFTTTTTAFVKSSINLIQPPPNTSITILFDKINGRALLDGCPGTTVSSTIELALLGSNSSSTIKIYCNGHIE